MMARYKPKKKRSRGYFRNRMFWALVYTTLALLMLIGATLIVRVYVVIGDPYTPPNFDAIPLSLPMPLPLQDSMLEIPPKPTPHVKMIPVRVYFNEYELQAEIQQVGVTEDNAVDTVPSATVAGWLNIGSSPGDSGNSIISGHVQWQGKKGTFSVLHDMKIGNTVTIEFQNGSLRVFQVIATNDYELKNFPSYVTNLEGDARLTLITCIGDFDRTLGTAPARTVVECVENMALRRDIPMELADEAEKNIGD